MLHKYLMVITDTLLSPDALSGPYECIQGNIKVPREVFMDFIRQLVLKNVGAYTKQVKPPGLTSTNTLFNLVCCITKSKMLKEEVYPMRDYPYPSLFTPDQGLSLSFLDDSFRSLERIGGTFSHLESELKDTLTGFR